MMKNQAITGIVFILLVGLFSEHAYGQTAGCPMPKDQLERLNYCDVLLGGGGSYIQQIWGPASDLSFLNRAYVYTKDTGTG